MFDAVFSNFKSSGVDIKESDDIRIGPMALIDKLANVKLEYSGVISDIRELNLIFLPSLLLCIFDSKPTVNSMM